MSRWVIPVVLLSACDARGPSPRDDAFARIEPVDGDGPTGLARFRQTRRGVRVRIDLEGMEPGVYGVHVHAGSDCEAPGPHLDPDGAPHGGTGPRGTRHMGDMGNVVHDWGQGTQYQNVDPVLILHGPLGIVGHPLVISREQDDLQSSPDGRSGLPLACGLVEPGPRAERLVAGGR